MIISMLLLVVMAAMMMVTAVAKSAESVSTLATPTSSKRHAVTTLVTGLLTRSAVSSKTTVHHSTALIDSLLPKITSTTGTTMHALDLAAATKTVLKTTAADVLTGMNMELRSQIPQDAKTRTNTGLKEFYLHSNG